MGNAFQIGGADMNWYRRQYRYLLLLGLSAGMAGCAGFVTPDGESGNPTEPGDNALPDRDDVGPDTSSGTSTDGKPGGSSGAPNPAGDGNVDPSNPSGGGLDGPSPANPNTPAPAVDPGAGNPTFTCDENAVPGSLPLRRLSQVQYQNTLRDLLTYVVPNNAGAVWQEVESTLADMQGDLRQGPDSKFARLSRLDQTVQQQRVDDYYKVGERLAKALTSSSSRLTELVGECATAPEADAAEACMDAFISRFGLYSQRRPLEPNDIEHYRRAAGDAPYAAEDYSNVATVLLASPYTVYLVEHGVGEPVNGTVPLSAHELASRLSYHFWQTMPDQALLTAAGNGELETDEGYAAQVERILADPRAERGLSEFVFEWLENPFLEPLHEQVGTPAYDALLDGYEPSPSLKADMQQEVVDAALYAFRTDGSYADFFTSQQSFAKTDELAAIYGVEKWSGGEPPLFPEPERAGLITRAAFLASGLPETRPIVKGVWTRKTILCDDIPPPPADLGSDDAVELANASTREKVEARTGTGACAGCHVGLINDLGFVTENFDALGRVRTEQPLYDEDGNVRATAEVNTVTVPRVELSDQTVVESAADLTRLILESDKPYACFARQYFRFTFGRLEHSTQDGCVLAAMKEQLQGNASLADVFKTVALDPSFRRRSL